MDDILVNIPRHIVNSFLKGNPKSHHGSITKLFKIFKDALKESDVPEISIEDNRGGDVLTLKVISEKEIQVELGQCCVFHFKKRMRPGVLISMLRFAYDNAKDFGIEYDEEYKKELVDSVKDIDGEDY